MDSVNADGVPSDDSEEVKLDSVVSVSSLAEDSRAEADSVEMVYCVAGETIEDSEALPVESVKSLFVLADVSVEVREDSVEKEYVDSVLPDMGGSTVADVSLDSVRVE